MRCHHLLTTGGHWFGNYSKLPSRTHERRTERLVMQVVTKGSAIPINAKIAASTTTASGLPPAGDPKEEPLPKIVVVGIVVGSVVGTLLLVGVAWVTWYRLWKRGNTDVSDRTSGGFMPAQTGRSYHPEQTPRRQQHFFGPSRQTQQAGLCTGPIDPAHQPVAAEMEVKPYDQDPHMRGTFDSLQPPHPLDYKDQEHVELGDTSVQQHQERHEVEGDLPPIPGWTRRWSNGLERIHIRRGSNTNGSHGGGGTHF